MTRIFFNFIYFTILFFNTGYYCHGSENDGRPLYMQGLDPKCRKGMIGVNDKKLSYIEASANLQLEEKNSTYAFDLRAQQSDLANYYNNNISLDQNCNKTYKEIEIPVGIFSRETPKNPPVILDLHGSSGLSYDLELIDNILQKGMAYASFSRFPKIKLSKTQISNTASEEIHVYQQTWENQTELPLNHEIMMIYAVCKKLVELGTEEIYIYGHSRGGILALSCAMESNAKFFRKIEINGKIGSVKGYIPVSALPIYVTDITEQEPVTIVHGRYDTICKFEVMKKYYETYLTKQKNINFTVCDVGHYFFDKNTVTLKDSLFNIIPELWRNGFYGVPQTIKNVVKKFFFLTTGKKVLITGSRKGHNFNEACVKIDEEEKSFFPIKEGNIGSSESIEKLPEYFKNHTKTLISVQEVTENEEALSGRLVLLVNILMEQVSNNSNK